MWQTPSDIPTDRQILFACDYVFHADETGSQENRVSIEAALTTGLHAAHTREMISRYGRVCSLTL